MLKPCCIILTLSFLSYESSLSFLLHQFTLLCLTFSPLSLLHHSNVSLISLSCVHFSLITFSCHFLTPHSHHFFITFSHISHQFSFLLLLPRFFFFLCQFLTLISLSYHSLTSLSLIAFFLLTLLSLLTLASHCLLSYYFISPHLLSPYFFYLYFLFHCFLVQG